MCEFGRLRLSEESSVVVLKKSETVGVKSLGSSRLRIRFSPESTRWTVAQMALHTRFVRADRRQPQRAVSLPERCQAEPQPQLVEQRVEWQLSVSCRPLRSLISPAHYVAGVLFCSCRFHPPSILPISARCSTRTVYFFVSSACVSQASCSSNLIRSTRTIHRSRSESFSA